MKYTIVLTTYCAVGLAVADYVSYPTRTSGLSIRDHPSAPYLARRGSQKGPSRQSPPSKKVSVSVQGQGMIIHGDPMADSRTQDIRTGQTVTKSDTGGRHPAHVLGATIPEGPPTTRWPVKTKGEGKHVVAVARTPSGGSAHMLLTAPDKAPQQIHVPGGASRAVMMSSDAGARIRTVMSKGGHMITDAHDRPPNEHEFPNLNRGGETQAGLPIQYGSKLE